MKLIVGITGASGSIYAKKLIKKAFECGDINELVVIPSENSFAVWKQELFEDLNEYLSVYQGKIKVYSNDNFFSSPASGSSYYDSMIIIPCSMATLAKISNGISNTLMTRAADVMLKERRKLILAIREAPYSLVHIENMKKVTQAGAVVFPLSPVFYNNPSSIDELVNYTVERILISASVCKNSTYVWGE
jgi:4-hydroxy-3-polyprenylbenzoate decarboxylase